ncbi:MAG: exo-beta-N-acetylmuramidase NamZ family protein, partial [Rhodothermales bacterium]
MATKLFSMYSRTSGGALGALLLALALIGCAPAEGQQEPSTTAPSDVRAAVKTGAQVLAAEGFDRLRGRRVGLVANHTAMVGSVHLIDAMDGAADVDVSALFGPEHGLRGEDEAGDAVEDGRDVRTGAPIYSLYGATRKPTPEMLTGLDVLVFDIQDIGARFYTYISTMGLAMQAAAEAGIPFVVLDRPNPLGGQYVAGFVLEPEHHSFVGAYPIPVAHG